MKKHGSDGDFEVRIGRIRGDAGLKKAGGFLKKVARASKQRLGRTGVGQRRASTQHFQRRVMVKASFVKLTAYGSSAQAAHLNYLERDGAGEGGGKPDLYSDLGSDPDAKSFLESCDGDRHYFKIIVSPEDAHEMADLSAFTRDLVSDMEHDLGTKLEWVAANHYDTDQPHTHLVVRGKREDGADLVLPRRYIAHGIRERAQDLASVELGPVTELAGQRCIARMVNQERWTELDALLERHTEGAVFNLGDRALGHHAWRRQLYKQRLNKLASLDLAEPLGKGRWHVDPQAKQALKRMGERVDILKTLHRAIEDTPNTPKVDAASIYDSSNDTASRLTGSVLSKGVRDDVTDRAYIIVSSMEGRAVYVDVGGEDQLSVFAAGQIVTVSLQSREPRSSDYVIAEIAGQNGGRYSPALHAQADRTAKPEYIQSHVRRLEALRMQGHVTRQQDGSWVIPEDYLSRAQAYEKAKARNKPAHVKVRSHLTLAEMTNAIGATWLDENLGGQNIAGNAQGFGQELAKARLVRKAFLTEKGFIGHQQQRSNSNLMRKLTAADLASLADDLENETGKRYTPHSGSSQVDGLYKESVLRPSGKFAVIERAKDFTLVPWREVMDRKLGKMVSGIARGEHTSWNITRGRGIS